MLSLTGFGRSTSRKDNVFISCEILSLNKKGIEIQIYMPKEYQFLEVELRKQIETCLVRGKISVSLKIENELAKQMALDINAYKNWKLQLKKLSQLTGQADEPRVGDWLQIKELWKSKEATIEEDKIRERVFPVLSATLAKVVSMRRQEGSFLKRELLKLIGTIELTHKTLVKRINETRLKSEKKLDTRIQKIAVSSEEADFMTRLKMLFMDKGDVQEELTRLKSHCLQFRKLSSSGNESVGRTLDFLMQEIHREINTLGSKTSDLVVSEHVILLKTVAEQVREQVQNIL